MIYNEGLRPIYSAKIDPSIIHQLGNTIPLELGNLGLLGIAPLGPSRATSRPRGGPRPFYWKIREILSGSLSTESWTERGLAVCATFLFRPVLPRPDSKSRTVFAYGLLSRWTSILCIPNSSNDPSCFCNFSKL